MLSRSRMSFPSINRLTRVEGVQSLSVEMQTGPSPGTAADGGDCPHETGLSVLDAALMVLSRLRCLDSHILANALIWFPIEAAHWPLGRGGAQSRHHIRRHAVDGGIQICGWLGRHSSLFEAGVVQSPVMCKASLISRQAKAAEREDRQAKQAHNGFWRLESRGIATNFTITVTGLKLKLSWTRSGVASGVVASAAARANGAPMFSTQPYRREWAR
ncbi:hypothetical protein FMUND_12742 [Fusarium mundagurra]|uniref:Uncharacterized protein n=1 Tax=Fusarium mundagurra TaxID=1567541 RepID=A0A8H5Y1B5_9HYPO|nr:hypothetical protein FMUND_12742 [Fusarium mundagurra]